MDPEGDHIKGSNVNRIAELKKDVRDKRWSIDKIFLKAVENLVDGIQIAKSTDTCEQRIYALEQLVRSQGEAIKKLAGVIYSIRDKDW
jgi:hypothetical protein